MHLDYRVLAWIFLIGGLVIAGCSFIEDIRPYFSNAMFYGGIALFILSFFLFAVQDILDALVSHHKTAIIKDTRTTKA